MACLLGVVCTPGGIKIVFDPRTGTLTLILKGGPMVENDEAKLRIIQDYDAGGDLVSVEVLNASKRVTEPQGIEFQMAEA